MEDIRNLDDILLSPLFIVGAGRSGTTWLQRMFLSHPNVVGGQESEFFLVMASAISSVKAGKSSERKPVGLSSYWEEPGFYEEVRELWKKTFASLVDGHDSPQLLVEKTPSHCFHIATIKEVLPQAKFIHIIRDSRAVVASMLAASRGWGKHWAPGTAKDAAVSWWLSVNAGRQHGAKLSSDNYIEVHYESLLANPEKELRRLYAFSGLPFSDDVLMRIVEANQFEKQKKSTEAAFVTSRGEGITVPKGFLRKGQADSWKNDLTLLEKAAVWRYTRRLMYECGYNWKGFLRAFDEGRA